MLWAMNESAIAAAVRIAGGQASLARAVKVAPALVYQWLTGRRPVAAHHCRLIEAATGVTCHDLRPDVFGPTPEARDAASTNQENRNAA